MIYSEKQYTVSSAQVAKMKQALSAAEERAGAEPWLRNAEIAALKSQIADMCHRQCNSDPLTPK
jgi:HTH-type transcriptional regulator/antitoxin HigA